MTIYNPMPIWHRYASDVMRPERRLSIYDAHREKMCIAAQFRKGYEHMNIPKTSSSPELRDHFVQEGLHYTEGFVHYAEERKVDRMNPRWHRKYVDSYAAALDALDSLKIGGDIGHSPDSACQSETSGPMSIENFIEDLTPVR